MDCGRESQVDITEMNFYEFLEKVVREGKSEGGPKEPRHYQFEILTEANSGKLRGYLVFALIKFANEICGKKVEEINWDDVKIIQRYFNSFGFRIDYQPDQEILESKGGDVTQMGFRDFRLWFNPYF